MKTKKMNYDRNAIALLFVFMTILIVPGYSLWYVSNYGDPYSFNHQKPTFYNSYHSINYDLNAMFLEIFVSVCIYTPFMILMYVLYRMTIIVINTLFNFRDWLNAKIKIR